MTPDDLSVQLESRTGSIGKLSRTTRAATFNRLRSSRFRRCVLLTAKQEQLLQELLSSRQRFVRLAFGILHNREDAEDAVQDAFLSAYRNVRNFKGRSTVKTWFTKIVMNAALQIRRKRKKLLRFSLGQDIDNAVFVPDVQTNPELAYSQAESSILLAGLLGKIKPCLREAVAMAYYDELCAPEASAALGIPRSTYKARLLRGRHLLQEKTRKLTVSRLGA